MDVGHHCTPFLMVNKASSEIQHGSALLKSKYLWIDLSYPVHILQTKMAICRVLKCEIWNFSKSKTAFF